MIGLPSVRAGLCILVPTSMHRRLGHLGVISIAATNVVEIALLR